MQDELLLSETTGTRRPWLIALGVLAVAAVALASAFFGNGLHRASHNATGRSDTTIPLPRVDPVALREVAPDQARDINARRPIEMKTTIPARPFSFVGDAPSHERAIACLAAAAWYEAGDDLVGQASVIQVVLNRARHPAFPATICGVVFQGSDRPTGCQFTFACDGALARTPSLAAWQRAKEQAQTMLAGKVFAPVGWSTHYHTDWVVPYWSADLVKLAKVETQIFYLWPGYWGTSGAFRRTPGPVEPTVAALSRLSQAHAERGALTLDLAASDAMATAAVVPDKPPLVLEGVSKRSLGSTLVRSQHADQNLFFVQLDGKGFPGSYAIAALAICKGKARCTVLGWQDPLQIGQALPLADSQRTALTFVYVRDDHKGERALWNCLQFDRANKAQCLPLAKPAVDGLIQ